MFGFRATGCASLFVAAGCTEIVHPHPQPGLDDRMVVVAVLDPTSTRHAVMASVVEPFTSALTGARATMYRRAGAGGRWILVTAAGAAGDELGDEDELLCRDAYRDFIAVDGRGRDRACMILNAVLEPGDTYRIEVSADDRPTAVGSTVVVGDFSIESAELAPQEGPDLITMLWGRSQAAHRYLVGLGRQERPRVSCGSCPAAWFVDLDSAGFVGHVPQAAVDSAGPAPVVSVAALDRHYHAFLTSGHAWHLFSVPPRMNIDGGVGVVGSAILRSLPVVVKPAGIATGSLAADAEPTAMVVSGTPGWLTRSGKD